MKTFTILAAVMFFAVVGIGTSSAADKHLFYLHGCCVTKDSNNPRGKAYEKIVPELRKSGMNVHFELRYSDVSDTDAAAQQYAGRIAEEVRALLAKGVKPEDITVSGFSLGSGTSLVIAGLLANPRINYVLLAGCPVKPSVHVTIDYTKVKGRILSIVDSKDEKFAPCKGRLPPDVLQREIILETGLGHKLFLQTDPDHFKLWKDPLVNWAKGN